MMFSATDWKRTLKLGLILCLLSAPMWAQPGRNNNGWGQGQQGGRGGQGGGCGGGQKQNVPEGGSLAAYAALSGAVIAGSLLISRKRPV